MDKLEKPRPLRKGFRFNFPQPQRSGQRLIALTDIHQAYGTKQVYTGLDLEVERGERTVLVGPNGAGKSTLIKILAGEVPFQKGRAQARHECEARLLLAASRGHAGSRLQRAGGAETRRAGTARGRGPQHSRLLPLQA
jgi:ATPase subunit of ABC transporter with duplicated ATPase domains